MRVRALPPASGVGPADDQVVPGRLDLDVVLAAADDHGLFGHVVADGRAVALDRLDRRPDRRQRLLELDVRLVLVAQAALEPPAHAGELRGVERQALLLRHPDRHRLELLQPRGAAQLAPARADSARHLGLVARADLLHLDARAQQLAQLAPQVAEVDPLLAREEEGDLARVEGRLGLDQLDREVPAAHQLERRAVVLPLPLEVLILARQVAGVGLLDDALEGTGGGPQVGRDDHRAERGAALGLHQHAIVAHEEERTRLAVVDPAARPEADPDRESSCAVRESSSAPSSRSRGRSRSTSARARFSASPASASARPGDPSASGASWLACSAGTPEASSTRTTSGAGSGSRRTTWQRERTVGRRSAAEEATSTSTVAPGGSSSVFRSAFCACSLRQCASSSTPTLRAAMSGWSASQRVSPRTCSMRMSRRSGSRATRCRSGCVPAPTRVQCAQAPHAPPATGAAQRRRAAKASASVRLPMPAGPTRSTAAGTRSSAAACASRAAASAWPTTRARLTRSLRAAARPRR